MPQAPGRPLAARSGHDRQMKEESDERMNQAELEKAWQALQAGEDTPSIVMIGHDTAIYLGVEPGVYHRLADGTVVYSPFDEEETP